MHTRTVVRLGAVAFVAIAITVSVIEARMSPVRVGHDLTVVSGAGSADPLRAEMMRCQLLGAAGATDHDCLRAWAENRRRFLTRGSTSEAAPSAATAASINAMSGTASITPALNALEVASGDER